VVGEPLLTGGFRRELAATARLAGPLIGGQLTMVGMSTIDTVMAGRLDAVALGAVAVGSSVWASIMLFSTGVLMILAPSIAQAEGAGEPGRVAPLTRQTIWVSLGLAILGILIAANMRPVLDLLRVDPAIVPGTTGYLRALCWGVPAWAVYMVLRTMSEGLGATRPTLYFGLVGLAVNVPADWVLMYGKFGLPALGARGCGYATAAVWCFQLLGMAIYVARHRRYRHLELFAHFEPPDREAISRLLRLGMPVGVMWLMEVSMFTMVALLIGTMGTIMVAGHQVTINFAAFTFMVPLGLSMATSVRVGNAVGRRDPLGVRLAARAGLALSLCTQTVSASLMLSVPAWIAGIYTDDAAVIAIAVQLLFLAAIFQFSDGIQVLSAGILRGLNDTRVPMLITIVAYWLVGLPLGAVLGFRLGLGARGMWVGLIAGLTAAAVLLGLRYRAMSARLPADLAGESSTA
jgi:MATE family multidrug resistance protein